MVAPGRIWLSSSVIRPVTIPLLGLFSGSSIATAFVNDKVAAVATVTVFNKTLFIFLFTFCSKVLDFRPQNSVMIVTEMLKTGYKNMTKAYFLEM